MSMLSKVKKLGTKLFSSGKVEKDVSDDGSGCDVAWQDSPSKTKTPTKLGIVRKDGLHGASSPQTPSVTDMAAVVAQSNKSFTSTPAPFLSPAKRVALMSMQAHTSTDSLGIKSPTRNDVVLPAVQIVSHAVPTTAAAPTGPPDAGMTGSPMGSRRKSTPAALDMALRTAEGKVAIQQLLTNQQIKKPMAYAQYFGNSISSTATPSMPSPSEAPRPPLVQRFTKQALPEEDVIDGGDDMSVAAAAAAGAVPMTGQTLAGPKPTTPQGGAKRPPAESAAAPPSSLAQEDSEPALAAIPIPSPRAAPAKVKFIPPVEEARPVSAPRTKLLSISPHLPAIMMRKSWSMADYAIVRKMYTGYASTVYQATCKKSLEQVALKVYHMENLCELNHYQVYREIRVHSTLQHQNIIHLLASFQEGTDVVLVQEYAEGGDLYRLLHRNGGRLSERQAVEMVLHPFLLALHYLHTRGIMHRDVKPENVLFTENRLLKLADFGLAIDLNEERAVTRAGTLDYMAPEVLRCPPKNLPQENKNNAYLHYNNSVDAWAVGVFAYELVVGFPPFAGESQLDSVDKIMHSAAEFPEKMTELAKSFICQALQKHPGDRPTVIEMLHHPWIRSFQRRTSMLHIPPPRARRGSSLAYVEPTKLSPLPGTPTAEPGSPVLIKPAAAPAPATAAAAAAAGAAGVGAGVESPATSGPLKAVPLGAPSSGPLRTVPSGAPSSGPLRTVPSGGPSSGPLKTVSSTTSVGSGSQVPLFDGNPEDMTPEQIEEMIRKLMLAKQAAIDRSSAGHGHKSQLAAVPSS